MQSRVLLDSKQINWKTHFLQWEYMLVLVFIIVNLSFSFLAPGYSDIYNLRDATMTFLDKAFIVLAMVFVIILADIDISVASIVAVSSVTMAYFYSMGVPMSLAILICLAVGTLCGLFNGLLIVKFKELSAVIVTLVTMILYRGIAYVLLEDQAIGGFPEWFSFLGWGYVGPLPFILIVFAVFAVIFALLLHKTTFGRYVYAIGNNPTASRFSGIQVDKIKLIVFTLTGLMAALTALFLTSKMGSTRPNIAMMYELEVIAMVVLGGVSTAGGKGRMIGPIIAIFLVGFLRYGMGLLNVAAQTQLIIIGLLLVIAVSLTNLRWGRA
ncbi:rhamnose transport system permease protein [Caldalkalibacillus uzonensis]|uniref:Autoinducer 2 import system permease protein LsrD n=1 Tax=Caldalkalibacillus uzonensis TaxID=353224 RepID=A0ABU0CQJ9_9BACI|nr:ABC transporter permease [Caldalkalibacillus uzonensis]MDQ0338695.1 rhamnose transport system permease protein [Caldalkalibacillus uzonensis]